MQDFKSLTCNILSVSYIYKSNEKNRYNKNLINYSMTVDYLKILNKTIFSFFFFLYFFFSITF